MPEENKKIASEKGEQGITAISLFSGAGGMDTGFAAAGINVVCANELDATFCETFSANHPETKIIQGDIAEHIDELPNNADLVFGGPPCQGFSIAGKMRSDDPRSQLIFRFLDVVEKCRPKMFVMENVKALGTLSRFEGIRQRYYNRVSELGYVCVPMLCVATDYGVPQKRERVFFVGIKDEASDLADGETPAFANEHVREMVREAFEAQKTDAPTVKEFLADIGPAGTEKNPLTCTAKITYCKKPVMRSTPYAGMYFNGAGRPIDLDGWANTLPASMSGNKTPIVDEDYLYNHAADKWVEGYYNRLASGMGVGAGGDIPERMRRLTITEAARLQTFPDDYIWKGAKSTVYKQIGNAVPCKMANAVANAMLEIMSKIEFSE